MNVLSWIFHPWRLMMYMDAFLNKLVLRLKHQDQVIAEMRREIQEHVKLTQELIPELQAKINPR